MRYPTYLLTLLFVIFANAQSEKQNQYEIAYKYSFDNFEKMKTIHKHLNNINIYDLKYNSFDNTKVKGFLIVPNNPQKKCPVLIFNRGGNGSYGMVSEPFIIKFLSRFANKGFIVIGSQLRGSEGSEGIDDFGGKSSDDVLALFKIINDLKIADTTKIAQMGWSRGGITNFQLLKKTNKIKTTINIAGPSDILKTDRKEMFTVYRNRIKNYTIDSVFYSKRVSPIFQIDSIKNKTESFLFLHGKKDDKVNVSNSYELFEKTKKEKYKSKLVIIEDSDHSLFDQIEKVIQEIKNWLNSELSITNQNTE